MMDDFDFGVEKEQPPPKKPAARGKKAAAPAKKPTARGRKKAASFTNVILFGKVC